MREVKKAWLTVWREDGSEHYDVHRDEVAARKHATELVSSGNTALVIIAEVAAQACREVVFK